MIDATQQRRLAAAGWTDDADDLSGGDHKVDSAQNMALAEVFVKPLDLDHGAIRSRRAHERLRR